MSALPHISEPDIARIENFTNAELDALPFGAIQLDKQGTILRFNEYEANLSDNRARDAIGRNFFRDVAPCTNVRAFHGRFTEGLQRGELNETFDYRFEFRPRPRDVRVTLYLSAQTSTIWVFVQER